MYFHISISPITRKSTGATLARFRSCCALRHAGPSDADRTQKTGTSDQTPPPDEQPLLVDGVAFPNIWRKARLVVVEEGKADEDIVEKLTLKGVRIMERPDDPVRRASFEKKLSELLKG